METRTATCATCRFLHTEHRPAKALPSAYRYPDGTPMPDIPMAAYDRRTCRIRAPLKGDWPAVRLTDWCGEHEPNAALRTERAGDSEGQR